MKKIFITLIFGILATSAHCQTTDYDFCNFLRQYEGKWQYTDGNDLIKVYLRKYQYHSNETHDVKDILVGWHEYSQGGVVIESNYAQRFSNLPYEYDDPAFQPNYSISLYIPDGCNDALNELEGYIKDLSQGTHMHTVKIFVTANKTQFSWNQYLSGIRINNINAGMTLPHHFTLTKQ